LLEIENSLKICRLHHVIFRMETARRLLITPIYLQKGEQPYHHEIFRMDDGHRLLIDGYISHETRKRYRLLETAIIENN
jgi:hypothetical protein